MSNIHTILPLLSEDTWEWGKDELVNEQVPAGRSEDLFSSAGIPGYLFYGLVVVQGPEGEKTEVEIDLDKFQLKSTIEEAYTVGSTDAGSISPGIARYDTENDVYAVVFEPSPPLAYASNSRIRIVAPSESDINVNSDALRLNILDRRGFIRSYQEATISGLLEQFGRLEDEMRASNENIEQLIEELQSRRADIV